jgi:dTDP-4-dehydrorhamnose 3,5-epimerase
MEFIPGQIDGLVIIKPRKFEDERGYFFESYNENSFREAGVDVYFSQDNQSGSMKNVLRGLHFQTPPFEQGKLVRVIKGAVLDVAVDIRKSSPTYGKWDSIILSEENNLMYWIPPGFAHGFLSLADNTLFSYKCTKVYNKESEGSIIWNDPDLNIDWQVDNPSLSDKDLLAPRFKDFVSQFD